MYGIGDILLIGSFRCFFIWCDVKYLLSFQGLEINWILHINHFSFVNPHIID